jgi:hypothetical protein
MFVERRCYPGSLRRSEMSHGSVRFSGHEVDNGEKVQTRPPTFHSYGVSFELTTSPINISLLWSEDLS